MNLTRKKQLASSVLKVGKNRICFSVEHLSEIKEAITKQDIKDLYAEGIISIKPVKGRKKIKRRKIRRGPGKIKKKVKTRKQDYVKITRKLRAYLKILKENGRISNELFRELRKKIRMRYFRSKAHLKEHLESLEDVDLYKPLEPKIKTEKKVKAKKKVVKKIKKEENVKKLSKEKKI